MGAHVVDIHPKKVPSWLGASPGAGWCSLLRVANDVLVKTKKIILFPMLLATTASAQHMQHSCSRCMGFSAAWDGCRSSSHCSLDESADYTCVLGVYRHVNKSQQLILRANTRILASLTSACYSIILWFMLGIVVMNETVILGYSFTDNVKKRIKPWWQSIIPQLFLFW